MNRVEHSSMSRNGSLIQNKSVVLSSLNISRRVCWSICFHSSLLKGRRVARTIKFRYSLLVKYITDVLYLLKDLHDGSSKYHHQFLLQNEGPLKFPEKSSTEKESLDSTELNTEPTSQESSSTLEEVETPQEESPSNSAETSLVEEDVSIQWQLPIIHGAIRYRPSSYESMS